MLKLIRADLYKSFHRMYLFIFMAALSGMAIFVNSVLLVSGSKLESSIGLAPMLLMYPLFLISMFADIVMAEENKEHTLKNTISFGVQRVQLILAKNVSTILVAFSVAFVTVLVYLASAFILLRPEKGDISAVLIDFFLRLGVALLIYIAASVLATFLAAVLKRNAMFTFAYLGILLVPVMALKLLNLLNPIFGKLMNLTMFMQAQIIAGVPQAQLWESVLNAVIHIAVFLVMGVIAFRKQEIN